MVCNLCLHRTFYPSSPVCTGTSLVVTDCSCVLTLRASGLVFARFTSCHLHQLAWTFFFYFFFLYKICFSSEWCYILFYFSPRCSATVVTNVSIGTTLRMILSTERQERDRRIYPKSFRGVGFDAPLM